MCAYNKKEVALYSYCFHVWTCGSGSRKRGGHVDITGDDFIKLSMFF